MISVGVVCRPMASPGPIGINLKLIRERLKLSQRELADRTNGQLTQADVSRIEGGETQDPGASKLRALALALGVDMLAFWDGESPASGAAAGLDTFLASPLAQGVTDEERR